MTARRFVVLSNARNGSNQLVQYINQFPGCVCHGEIFKRSFTQEPAWPALAARLGDPAVALRLHDQDLTGFWDRLVASYGEETAWIGAKIFYEHRLDDPLWDSIFDPATPVIHLWRRRVLEAFLSLITAETTGEWMSVLGGPPSRQPAQPLHFPVRRYLDYREAVQEKFQMVTTRLAGHEKVLSIEYGEISRPQDLAPRLGGFFGRQGRLTVTLRKQTTRSPLDLVSNPDEVVPFLNDALDRPF